MLCKNNLSLPLSYSEDEDLDDTLWFFSEGSLRRSGGRWVSGRKGRGRYQGPKKIWMAGMAGDAQDGRGGRR
jgi:hypothetical protein